MKFNARLFVTAWFCLAVVAAHVPAFAQGGGATTSLSGTVTDTSGAIIPGANVVVKSNATATQFDAVTNESGYFSVPALDPGAYTVTVTLMGFKTAVLNDVRVNASTPATVKVALAVGGLEETVVVTGGAEIIQTTSAAVTSTIDANQILKIPTGSRSALEFVRCCRACRHAGGPGGSRDSMVNGLPQSAINITIDGMSAQDNHLKTGDGFFARVSPRLDAIEEVTVNSAAQDSASTGQGAVQIRFVTRSGSNQFTGSALLLPAALQAQLEHVVQQPRQRAESRRRAPSAWRAVRRPHHHPRTVERPEQGVLLRQLRGIPFARCEAPRTGRFCTRARSRVGSATPRAARLARSTSSGWARRTRPSIRRSPGCSAIFGAPPLAALWSITPIRSPRT